MKLQGFFKIFILSVVLCSFFLSSCSVNQHDSGQSSAANGGKAPAFTLKDLSGESVSLSDFLKRKNVLLIFTTTWCPHCITVIPDLKKIYSGYKDKNLEVLAVYIREADSMVSEFKARHGVPYKVLLDSDASVASVYNVPGVPTFVLVDTNGYIKYKGHDIPKDIIEQIQEE